MSSSLKYIPVILLSLTCVVLGAHLGEQVDGPRLLGFIAWLVGMVGLVSVMYRCRGA